LTDQRLDGPVHPHGPNDNADMSTMSQSPLVYEYKVHNNSTAK